MNMNETMKPVLRVVEAQQPQAVPFDVCALDLAAQPLDAVSIIARAMQNSRDRNDLRSFTRTWPDLRLFASKLALTITDIVPGAERGVSLLQESLEAACFGYLSAGAAAPAGLDVARFLGGGLAAAARGIGALSIVGYDSDMTPIAWNPRMGGIARFVADKRIETLRFSSRAHPAAAERVALRNWLVQEAMRFEDDVRMVRAGVDWKTFEPY